MVLRLVFTLAFCCGCLPSLAADDFDAPFAELGELPKATVAGFKYKLSLQPVAMQSYIMQGHFNGVTTQAPMLRFRAESPERIPGDARMRVVRGKTTSGYGVIDIVAVKEDDFIGKPEYPPDKPARMFWAEVRTLRLTDDDELRLRIRFKDASDHYLLRYQDGKGLRLEPLATEHGRVDAGSIPEFSVLTLSEGGTEWHCNALSTWATTGGKVLWSADVPMEGQPKSMNILEDALFVTTSAGHSFYICKDTGKVAFYDKTILPGEDPMIEVLALGRKNMANLDKRRSLARFITAAVVLNDRRAIPFLIDCIDKGDGLQSKAMAVAALEKFNGNPDLWAPKNPEAGQMQLHWVGMKRVYPDENRQAEIAKWRKVFADELDDTATLSR